MTDRRVPYGESISHNKTLWAAFDGERLVCVAATADDARRKYREARKALMPPNRHGENVKAALADVEWPESDGSGAPVPETAFRAWTRHPHLSNTRPIVRWA